ncbi:nonstructural protein [Blackfly microvirus SF02]|uniref:Nonstructural protein n=1 Tax=Blackfly microvirus SF02 TaxID=2576452 RepID=A0A4P8PTE7_9VIRU|nr:nonstructural protein [Blackfly microvirus SF02]QCQ84836.1 nonstructural protein [Blackfly microvirus SF02]
MKLLMCSVFDSKVGAYSPPFCVKTQGEAIRSFADACGDDKLPFSKHPGDYRLFLVGSFDDNSGVLDQIVPQPLIGADEI